MKGALIAAGMQLVVFALAWRVWTLRPVPPEDVLKDLALCFFFWWVILPVDGVVILNEWTTQYVRHRRESVKGAATLRSGQENGLYE